MTATVVFFAPHYDRKHKAEQERDIDGEPARFFEALLIAVPFSALCWYGLYWLWVAL